MGIGWSRAHPGSSGPQVETCDVDLRFLVHVTGQGMIDPGAPSDLRTRLAADFVRWDRMVALVRRLNAWFARGWGVHVDDAARQPESVYVLSAWNPANVIPARLLARLFGISQMFWTAVVVPIYSSTFLTVDLDTVPSVVVPAIDAIIPVGKTARLRTWRTSSAEVFDKLARGVTVHCGVDVDRVEPVERGTQVAIVLRGTSVSSLPRTALDPFDYCIMACGAPAAVALQPRISRLERLFLSNISYADPADQTFVTVSTGHSLYWGGLREPRVSKFFFSFSLVCLWLVCWNATSYLWLIS